MVLSIEKLGTKSVTYRYDIRLGDRPVATGKMAAVCCQIDGDKPVSIPIPDDLRTRLEPYVRATESSDS